MHHLHALDQLVTNLSGFLSAPSTVTLSTFNDLLEEAITLSAKLRAELLQQAFANKDKKQMKVFVQTYQAVCIDMCNKFSRNEKELIQPGIDKKLLKTVMQKNMQVQDSLLELLKFIEHHFPLYFDTFQVMPVQLAAAREEEVQRCLDKLIELLPGHFDPPLVGILVAPVDSFIKLQTRVHQTFSQLAIIKKYIGVLNHIVDESVDDPVSALMYSFIEIGYSPKEFVFYYLDHMKSIVHTLTEEDRFNTISRHLKIIEFLPVPPGSIISASLKTVIIKSLREEINGIQQPRLSTNSARLPKMEGKPLQTPMSVAQLGLFIRLLVESGTIKCDNHSLLLRMIASTFKTSKTVAISPGSLRSKYYATDPASVNIVKEYVIRMMNHLITCK